MRPGPAANSVHPRTGGERNRSDRPSASSSGSSPHGRGTPERARVRHPRRRFIPARAGNAVHCRFRANFASVHPRTGGERRPMMQLNLFIIGSSPHGRGTPDIVAEEGVPARFIPARAGNARSPRPRRGCAPVHPRTGGERSAAASSLWPTAGSSPHGRGTQPCGNQAGLPVRFIPARAGNARAQHGVHPVDAVHPRTGGERRPRSAMWTSRHGSSPHGRGTHDGGPEGGPRSRFIPARAGNASRRRPPGSTSPVHPRTGGERQSAAKITAADYGSSPHGRGTHVGDRRDEAHGRFIPARAGNALRWCRSGSTRAVHPRTGGERADAAATVARIVGSSPHGRGTRHHRPAGEREARFIPARAGNASVSMPS